MPGGLGGDVKDTRADGKCAYVDVWQKDFGLDGKRVHACGWGNLTSYDYDYTSEVHVLLYVL